MRRCLPLLIVAALAVSLCGCVAHAPPPGPNDPATQPIGPAVDQQQQILETAASIYRFDRQLLTDIHAQGGISDANWTGKYLPAFGIAETALAAWQANVSSPGSVDAQAKFEAAAVDIALFVVEQMRSNPQRLAAAAQRIQPPRNMIRRR